MKITKTLLTMILTIPFLVMHAQIIHVATERGTIQSTIDVAVDGDTVLVEDGTYMENINFMGKAITLASYFIVDGDTNHINNTVIDGNESGSTVTFNSGEDTTSILMGFTITGGTGTYVESWSATLGGGIFCEGSGARITNNIITGNLVSDGNKCGGGGIGSLYLENDHPIIIEYNTITGNACSTDGFSAFGGGIYSCNSATIMYNVIEDNHCDNPESVGSSGGGMSIERLNSSGDTIHAMVYGNTVRFNSVDGDYCNGGGIEAFRAPAIIEGNLITHNTVSAGYEAIGGGIYTYYAPLAVEITNNEIMYNVTSGETDAGGAGIYSIYPYENYLVENNIISHNILSATNLYWGAGVSCISPKCPVTFRYNMFSNNFGPIYTAPDTLILTGAGGGLCVLDPGLNEVKIEGNIFKHGIAKHGGGFYSRGGYNLRVSSNLFWDNETYVGAGLGIYLPGGPKTPDGQSTLSDTLRPVFSDNTFIDNTAEGTGGAIRVWNNILYAPVIFNSIFQGNISYGGGNSIYFHGDDTLYLGYSNIYEGGINGNWNGENNIYEDPLFVEEDSLFHITGESPCFNTGADSVEFDGMIYYCSTIDYDGDTRPYPDPLCPAPDMGADEVDELCVGISQYIESDGLEVSVYPNPTDRISDFGFRISDEAHVTLKIFDVHGKEAIVLLDEHFAPGEYQVRFDASRLAPGVYFFRLTSGRNSTGGKLVIY